MCGGLFSPDMPEMKQPPKEEPKPQEAPQFGAADKDLNSRKNLNAKRRGSSGFKIDLQTPNQKSGLSIGGM